MPPRLYYCHIPCSARANYIIRDNIDYKFPHSFLASGKPSDLPIIKHLRNKADYAYRKCAKTDETVKKLLAEKELVNNHHLDHVYTQKKLEKQVIVSQANELRAPNLLEARTNQMSNSLNNEEEK